MAAAYVEMHSCVVDCATVCCQVWDWPIR